jgi:cytochrome c
MRHRTNASASDKRYNVQLMNMKTTFAARNRNLLQGFSIAVVCLTVGAAMAQPGRPPQSRPAPKKERDGAIATGKMLYEENCEICHFADSTALKIGPGMKGLYARGTLSTGKKVDDASVSAVIENGGKDMQGFKDILKPEQIRAIVIYLKTL